MGKNERYEFRNHPSYMLESSWGALIALFMVFFNGADDFYKLIKSIMENGIKDLVYVVGIGGGVLVFLLLALFFSYRRWKKTTITIAEGNLTWEQATMFSKRQEYAISAISNVNLEQNIFERIIGTYKLKLDTSSISTANETDMKILLAKKDAMQVRALLLQMMEEAETSTVTQITNPEDNNLVMEQSREKSDRKSRSNEYDFQISPTENVLCAIAGIKESQVFWLLVIFAILLYIIVLALKTGQSIGEFFVMALALFSGGFSLLKSLVHSFLKTYNYKVKRNKDHIYISSGALKIQSYSVPVKQIQALRMDCTLIGRIMNRVSVSVVNVSGEGEDVDGQWLLPPIPREDLAKILKTVLPEYRVTKTESFHKRPKKVLALSLILEFVLMAALFVGLQLWIPNIPEAFFEELGVITKAMMYGIAMAIWGFVVLFWLITSFLRQKTEGILLEEDMVSLRRGGISWNQIEMKYDKIQILESSENILDRVLGLRKGNIRLLASSLALVQKIPRFEKEILEELKEKFCSQI